MTYSHAAAAYREHEVLTASPAQLVVIVYDHALANLTRARMAFQAGNIEARVEATGKARDALVELMATLDVERGGQLAENLRGLYGFLINQLLDLGLHPDARLLDRVTTMVSELRSAFAAIAERAVEAPAA